MKDNTQVGRGVAALQAKRTQQAESDRIVQNVAMAYPGLTKHLAKTAVQWGTPSGPEDDRQLEFYQPWEGDNPNPGKATVELFNRDLKGKQITDSVALDMLHHVGAVDPQTNQPVDPDYYPLKQQMLQQVKAAAHPWDKEAYQDDVKAYGPQSYDDWLAHNRTDAYIRGYISPEMNPEWQQPGIYSPDMVKTGDAIKRYLTARPSPAQ